MKLNAVAVSSSDFSKSKAFYSLLGFSFPAQHDTDHIESEAADDSIRLMIDSVTLVETLSGSKPQPATHSQFAIEYDSPEEVDRITASIKQAGFEVEKEPWDSFWGQRYAVVKDPDGYLVDLYAQST